MGMRAVIREALSQWITSFALMVLFDAIISYIRAYSALI